MTKSTKKLTELAEWQALVEHQKTVAPLHMRNWFTEDEQRFSDFSLEVGGLFLDYSRNRINKQTIDLLIKLANAQNLSSKMNELLTGKPINYTEKRPAL